MNWRAERGRWFWLAASVWLVSVLLALWLSLTDPVNLGWLAFTTVGALVVWLRPSNPIGWVLVADGLLWLGGGATQQYVSGGGIGRPGAAVLAAVFDAAGWIAALGLIPIALLLFPTGRPPAGRWHVVGWLIAGGAIVAGLANLATPGRLPSYPAISNPFGIATLASVAPVIGAIAEFAFLVGGGGAILATLVRFRRASGIERQQLRWLAFAAMLVAGGVLVGNVITAAGLPGGWVFHVMPTWALPIAVAVALLRYRLWDLDLVVERTVTYALVGLGVAAIYVAVIAGVGALVGNTGGLWLAVLATAVAGLLLQPALGSARAAARRLIFPVETSADGTPVSVRTLGGFRVELAGRPIGTSDWQSRKARQLLKMLIARRGRPTHREQLIDALWPGETTASLGNRLAVTVSTLRSVLDPTKSDRNDWFVNGDADSLWVQLDHVAVDVEHFLDAARAALAGGDLDAAEAAYGGDFLEEDAYEDWAQPLREEARALYLAVLRAQAQVQERRGVDAAVAAHLRILEVDPWDEGAHLAIVSALEGVGRHGEARRARSRYAARMQELDLDPPVG